MVTHIFNYNPPYLCDCWQSNINCISWLFCGHVFLIVFISCKSCSLTTLLHFVLYLLELDLNGCLPSRILQNYKVYYALLVWCCRRGIRYESIHVPPSNNLSCKQRWPLTIINFVLNLLLFSEFVLMLLLCVFTCTLFTRFWMK